MEEWSKPFANANKFKKMDFESLYNLLRSMVVKAETDQLTTLEKDALLKNVDELHAYILLMLGNEQYSLEMLMANHSEVYDQVLSRGTHIKSLI